MAWAPRTALMFLLFSTLYNITAGLTFGAYTAVVLEAIGKGAAATKFNLLSSISNLPIMLTVLAEGWAHGHGGATSVLLCEALLGVASIVLYSVVARLTRDRSWPLERHAALPV